jgi:hypothetical protein
MGSRVKVPVEKERNEEIHQGGEKGNPFKHVVLFIPYHYKQQYAYKGQEDQD